MGGQNFALVMVAAIAALIAYMQWVPAHPKVVVDFFDRRRIELVEDALRPVFREAEVSGEALSKVFAAKSECRFLFGKDVNDYLDLIHQDYGWLASRGMQCECWAYLGSPHTNLPVVRSIA